MKKLLVPIMTAATIAAGSFFGSAPAAEARDVGGISIEAHCQRNHGPAYHAVLRYWGALGWRCTSDKSTTSQDRNVNFWVACLEQYPGTTYPAAYYKDYNNPYSWTCYMR